MPPRQGYQSRTEALAGLKSALSAKPHAVHWRRADGERRDYLATCNCGWQLQSGYGAVRAAIRAHLYPEEE